MLTNKLKSDIKNYALSNSTEEVCGLIISKDNNLEIFKCNNSSYHKTNFCILNPLDYIRAANTGKIVAHFHSHPGKEKPSFMDYLNATNHNIYSIIYSIGLDEFFIIEPKLKNYLNLDFHIGFNDCFELIRNYYKNELNISIPSYHRDNNWEKKNPNYILDNYKDGGFYKVDYKDIKINDVIVFNMGRVPQHLSIYLDNNLILHYPINDKSTISELTPELISRINIVLRHKDIKYE